MGGLDTYKAVPAVGKAVARPFLVVRKRSGDSYRRLQRTIASEAPPAFRLGPVETRDPREKGW